MFLVILFISAILSFKYVESPYVSMDKLGENYSCDSLISNSKSGNADLFSYYMPSLFAFSNHYKTVRHYELSLDYKFNNCSKEIEDEVDGFCADIQKSVTLNNFTNKENTHILACDLTREHLINNFENEFFAIKPGKNPLIKINKKWFSLINIRLSEPREEYLHDSGLWEVCVSSGDYSYCPRQRSKADSFIEYNRILEYMTSA